MLFHVVLIDLWTGEGDSEKKSKVKIKDSLKIKNKSRLSINFQKKEKANLNVVFKLYITLLHDISNFIYFVIVPSCPPF